MAENPQAPADGDVAVFDAALASRPWFTCGWRRSVSKSPDGWGSPDPVNYSPTGISWRHAQMTAKPSAPALTVGFPQPRTMPMWHRIVGSVPPAKRSTSCRIRVLASPQAGKLGYSSVP